MQVPTPTLRGTPTHEVAVLLYQGHRDDGSGLCGRCGERAPCAVRWHAGSVIAACGEDPRWYDDGRLSAPTPAPPAAPGAQYRPDPDHTGYAVGGRGERMSPDGFLYERER